MMCVFIFGFIVLLTDYYIYIHMVKLESTLMRFMLELVTRTNIYIYIYDMT